MIFGQSADGRHERRTAAAGRETGSIWDQFHRPYGRTVAPNAISQVVISFRFPFLLGNFKWFGIAGILVSTMLIPTLAAPPEQSVGGIAADREFAFRLISTAFGTRFHASLSLTSMHSALIIVSCLAR
ncbi:MAG: hypothetical protein Q8K86_07225 [Candidatus Nanopelagicaceae bacterium]|nr:hypothetical protein [Candidatus Nanopelagicaceae bacterium]